MTNPKVAPFFPPQEGPRVFACQPGQDFAQAFVDGLRARAEHHSPEAIANVTVYLSTNRMKRRVTELFQQGSPGFLPKLKLITEFAQSTTSVEIPTSVPSIRRLVELRQLVTALLENSTDRLAPLDAVPDLAKSLADILDEFSDAGVSPQTLGDIDVSDQSGHWQKSLKFLDIIAPFCTPQSGSPPGVVARFRAVAEALIDDWSNAPVNNPIIIAGSTGSRGTTQLLMDGVAKLTQGALVLPGFSAQEPSSVWERLRGKSDKQNLMLEDHPQFRYAHLMDRLGMTPDDITPWHGQVNDIIDHRNKFVSLALRPAPVTHEWMRDAPKLQQIGPATSGIDLIEARSPRHEASCISLAMRECVELNRSVALVTQDQTLTRTVTALLDRWGIDADSSMGDPMPKTPPGRLMRQMFCLTQSEVETEPFIALLKHPLVAFGSNRPRHLAFTRALELWLRRKSIPFLSVPIFDLWAQKTEDEEHKEWITWLGKFFARQSKFATLETHIHLHKERACALVAGPSQGAVADELWKQDAGECLSVFFDDLTEAAPFGGSMSAVEYQDLFETLLQDIEARSAVTPRPDVMIWGTMEARVQGADVVILGGLNEGSWPSALAADPWLNRALRARVGLLLPERRIGLAAHDFQQAIAAERVILSRSTRDADSDTVPSRWLNRITNLLSGMDGDGVSALADMRARGANWEELADALDAPVNFTEPATRPAPMPPTKTRPAQYSVTNIRTLIRDPYAIYAEKILGLKTIPPLHPSADARLRGVAMHRVLEIAVDRLGDEMPHDQQADLIHTVASEVFNELVPWPDVRALWLGRLDRLSQSFVEDEAGRRSVAIDRVLEDRGEFIIASVGTKIVAKADRIDRLKDGTVAIFDYKSSVPQKIEIRAYEKQLAIEAVMAEAGAFPKLGPKTVGSVGFVGVGPSGGVSVQNLSSSEKEEILAQLETLLRAFKDPTQPFISRRHVKPEQVGDFDHLARFGEWTIADDPVEVVLK